MTNKRQGGQGKAGERPRTRIKSSHEKVKAGPAASRAKGPPRAKTSAVPAAARDRLRPLRKPRLLAQSPREDASGGWSVATESARDTAAAIAAAAIDKKAERVQILDVAGKVDYADFLVIMTGRSDRHAQALAQGIEEELKKKGVRPVAVEGLPQASWVLMDFGEVVVHVFQDEARQLYDIEGLWLDAHRLPAPTPVASE
ncbi:MAG: ribosome silencing factor [Polyangiaceae bacterium]